MNLITTNALENMPLSPTNGNQSNAIADNFHHMKLRVWSYLLKKSLLENFIFCAVRLIFLIVNEYESMIATY